MTQWLGDREKGEPTNRQKAVEVLGVFAYSPLVFRIGKSVFGSGELKFSLHSAQLDAVTEEIASTLAEEVPAFSNISVKIDEKFKLVSFKARIIKIKKRR